MDADRRHDLKTNELADALDKLTDLRDPRLRYWIAAIVLVAVAYLGYRYWDYTRQTALERSWADLSAVEIPDSGPVETAIQQLQTQLAAAQQPALRAGIQLKLARVLFEEARRDEARRESLLREAQTHLRAMLEDSGTPDALRPAALFALGCTHESLGELDQAAEQFRAIADPAYAGSPFVPLAADRVLNMDQIREPIEFVPGEAPPPPSAVGPPAEAAGPSSAPASAPADAPEEAPGEGAEPPGGEASSESPSTQPARPGESAAPTTAPAEPPAP